MGSAVGFLLAPVAFEVVRSRQQNLSALQADVINTLVEEMRREALAVVRQGTGSEHLLETRHAYMRYVGQGHEIPVGLPVENYGDQHGGIFRAAFEKAYTQLYGRIIEGVDIEVLSWTLTISAPSQAPAESVGVESAARQLPEPDDFQPLFDPLMASQVNAPVFLRQSLRAGDCLRGPVLITEDQTTTVVTSNYRAEIDARGYIVMTRRENSDD